MGGINEAGRVTEFLNFRRKYRDEDRGKGLYHPWEGPAVVMKLESSVLKDRVGSEDRGW